MKKRDFTMYGQSKIAINRGLGPNGQRKRDRLKQFVIHVSKKITRKRKPIIYVEPIF